MMQSVKPKQSPMAVKLSDPKAMLQAAEAMEKASKQMTDIPVNDPKLKDYQTGFVKMYQRYQQSDS